MRTRALRHSGAASLQWSPLRGTAVLQSRPVGASGLADNPVEPERRTFTGCLQTTGRLERSARWYC